MNRIEIMPADSKYKYSYAIPCFCGVGRLYECFKVYNKTYRYNLINKIEVRIYSNGETHWKKNVIDCNKCENNSCVLDLFPVLMFLKATQF